jgi:sarcosine oxidase
MTGGARDGFDAIVAGLGGMGSAVAAHAAARGMRVLGIDRFDEGHEGGASTGASRIFRTAYFEDPAYVPLLFRARALWRELERATGCDLLAQTGMLMVGDGRSAVLAGARESARLHGIAIEELSARDVGRRYPAFALRADETAIVEPDAGYVRPERAIAAHLRVAREAGATLRFGTALRSWEAERRDRVVVTLASGERVVARRLALCLGPWFADEMAALGVALRIQRNVQVWFRPAGARDDAATGLPVFFADRADYPMPLYGFPDLGDGLGIKAAFHAHGETTAPDALRRAVDVSDVDPLRRALDALLPGRAGDAIAAKACMYSLTPDEHFAIAPHARANDVVVAGGFSGHGFKFCSVVGEIVADLLEWGSSRHEIGFLSPARFATKATEA